MKLRIKGNSIRLRLGESEVSRLAEEGRISEAVQFNATPGQKLIYVVSISNSAKQISAGFHQQTISVEIPESIGRSWAKSSEVTLRGEQQVGNGSAFTILIEKDFKCLEPRPGEDESDSFPNPAQSDACGPH